VKILCIGGGPGGLYAALLLKKADPARDVTVVDRNPSDATYGWGVVFSDETLTFLEEADGETYRDIAAEFVRWEAIDIQYLGQTIRSGGHAFSGMGRKRLLGILQRRCAAVGVSLRFDTEIQDLSIGDGFDLVIAADGLNSRVRAAHSDVFKPRFDRHGTKYIWLGAHLPLDAFTFIFRETEYGMFQVHAYPFEEETCTFIVETTEEVWKRAGLEPAGERESLAWCERIFAEDLAGQPLLSNRSSWISFLTLRTETWYHENIVLLGDAAHTAHFSVGSGTKMAMEDAIALSEAVGRNRNLNDAMVEYEELRQPIVERTQQAARDSSMWFEHVERYARFEPVQFGFSLLTRSKRITYDNLKLRDPDFSYGVDRWFSRHEVTTQCTASPVSQLCPPVLNPFVLRQVTVANRLVDVPLCGNAARDGMPGERHLIALAGRAMDGPGLVMTEPIAVSAEGRVTPGCAGLYCPDHLCAWKRIVDAAHTHSLAKIAVRLSHAGRRGSTRPRSEGTDRPLGLDNWPLLSASPLRYTSVSQLPREMDRSDMRRVCEEFVRAARWAEEAGFDMLELHAGHGYLLASFLSPLSNRRSDAYGGSLENRLRFPLEVFDAVRAVWPQERPLSACFSATDWARHGLPTLEAVAIALAFKNCGCDLIHVVTGQTTDDANPPYGRSWETAFSDLIRNEALVPTMTGGNIATADEMNTILAAGRADLCIVAPRPIGDPGWILHMESTVSQPVLKR